MTKKLNKEQEEHNYILSIPRKPGYSDGCTYGRVLVEKIQWMDEHLGKLPAEYRSLFEISEEDLLKEMLRLYEENCTVRYFDECQNGVYSEALKALRVYRGIAKTDQRSRVSDAGQDYSVRKKHVFSMSTTEGKKIGLEMPKLENSYSKGEKIIKDSCRSRKESTDKAREKQYAEAVRRSGRAEKCKRKNAEEVLRKVNAEKKELECQSRMYWDNVFKEVKRKENNLEKYLKKMQGRPITEEDIRDIKNISMYPKYEEALKKANEKERKKRNRARWILNKKKREDKIQEEKTKLFWVKKEEDTLLKKYAGCCIGSDEWKIYVSIKLRRYEDEYKKAKMMRAMRGVKLQEKSEKIKTIRNSYIELRALQKSNCDEAEKKQCQRLKGKIAANQNVVCQLNMEIKKLSDNKDLLEEEYLRTSYNYRAQKYVNIHMSSGMEPIVKSNVERCLLFLEMPKDKQIERCMEIINNRKKKKERIKEEILVGDDKLAGKDVVEDGNCHVVQYLEVKKIDEVLESRQSCASEYGFEKNRIGVKKSRPQQQQEKVRNEKKHYTELRSALYAKKSPNYIDWCKNATNLRKVEAAIEVEEEKVARRNSYIFSELDIESILLEQQRKVECYVEYDTEDKMQDLQRKVNRIRKLSWNDFLVWLDLSWMC